jgi:hypothetical protein
MQCREYCIAIFTAFDSSEFVQRAVEAIQSYDAGHNVHSSLVDVSGTGKSNGSGNRSFRFTPIGCVVLHFWT